MAFWPRIELIVRGNKSKTLPGQQVTDQPHAAPTIPAARSRIAQAFGGAPERKNDQPATAMQREAMPITSRSLLEKLKNSASRAHHKSQTQAIFCATIPLE